MTPERERKENWKKELIRAPQLMLATQIDLKLRPVFIVKSYIQDHLKYDVKKLQINQRIALAS